MPTTQVRLLACVNGWHCSPFAAWHGCGLEPPCWEPLGAEVCRKGSRHPVRRPPTTGVDRVLAGDRPCTAGWYDAQARLKETLEGNK